MLAWLNLLALEKTSVAEIMQRHWQQFGRHYYQRHDYDNLDSELATEIIQRLRTRLPELTGQILCGNPVSRADEFEYHDPVDGSESHQQGLRIIMGDAARVIVRLSGTGTSGATLRVYLERFEREAHELQPEKALADLSAAACELLELNTLIGRTAPDLVT